MDHRCHCGQLLARVTKTGVEVKCKRCKRIELISWALCAKESEV